MRDILVTFIVIIGCFYTVKRPYIGIFLWSWLSYMNPQRLCYGFALNAPFAKMTALVLLGSMIYNKETKSFPVTALSIIWIIFILFMGITTYFAYFPDKAFPQYLQVIQVQLLVFLTMMLITDMDKLNKLIWVIVLSVGFYTVKGALFYLMTGGSFHIWGPSGTLIAETKELASAGLIILPMMAYLYQINDDKWVKLGLLIALILSLFTIVKSQSGAAFLTIFVVGIFYSIKKMGFLKTVLLFLLILFCIVNILSLTMTERIESFQTQPDNNSAMGQINAWHYAYNAASDNVLGMGFESWFPEAFALYAPNPNDVYAAHSIYFTILADHGWIGLFLYLLIYFMAWRQLTKIIKQTVEKREYMQVHWLAKSLQLGFIAYLVGGTFFNFSYFVLPWHLVAIVMILSKIVKIQPVRAFKHNSDCPV